MIVDGLRDWIAIFEVGGGPSFEMADYPRISRSTGVGGAAAEDSGTRHLCFTITGFD